MRTSKWHFVFWCFQIVVRISGEQHIACEGSIMALKCEPNNMLSIESARFGRFDSEPCSNISSETSTDWTCNATSNVLEIITDRCDGRPDCKLRAGSNLFGVPCDYSPNYLEVNYTCIEDPNGNHTFRDITKNRCYKNFNITLECVDDRNETMTLFRPPGVQVLSDCTQGWAEMDNSHYVMSLPCSNDRAAVTLAKPYANTTGDWMCRAGGSLNNSRRLWVDTAFPFFLTNLYVMEESRSAMVVVCARDDTEIRWNEGENEAEFEVTTVASSESCGVPNQFVMTSQIRKLTNGSHTFKVELLSSSCGDFGQRPMLTAECECEETDICRVCVEFTTEGPPKANRPAASCPPVPTTEPLSCPITECPEPSTTTVSAAETEEASTTTEDETVAEEKEASQEEECEEAALPPVAIALLAVCIVLGIITAFLARSFLKQRKAATA